MALTKQVMKLWVLVAIILFATPCFAADYIEINRTLTPWGWDVTIQFSDDAGKPVRVSTFRFNSKSEIAQSLSDRCERKMQKIRQGETKPYLSRTETETKLVELGYLKKGEVFENLKIQNTGEVIGK